MSSTDTDDGSDGISENKQFFDFDIPYRDYVKIAPVDVVYGKKKQKKVHSFKTMHMDKYYKLSIY